MNNFIKKTIAITVLSVCIAGDSASALGEKSAKIGAICGGVVCGALAGAFVKNQSFLPHESNIPTAVAALGVAGLSWWLFDTWFSDLTPTAKIRKAHNIIYNIERNSLVSRPLAADEALADFVNSRFIKSAVLSSLRGEIYQLRADLNLACSLIESSCEDSSIDQVADCRDVMRKIAELKCVLASSKSIVDLAEGFRIIHAVENDPFVKRCISTTNDEFANYTNIRFGTNWPLVLSINYIKKLDQDVENALKYTSIVNDDSSAIAAVRNQLASIAFSLKSFLEKQMSLVTNYKDYLFQVNLYENHQEAERQRAHEAALKASERAHEAALRAAERAHESYERHKDRWSAEAEKEKDRRLKQQALDMARNNNAPIMVGI